MKLHEYLAAGRPVVSADIESVRPFAHVLDIVASPRDWLTAIEAAIQGGGPGTTADRKAVARDNSWDHRVATLEDWLRAM